METITFFALLFVSMAPVVMLWLVVRPAKRRDEPTTTEKENE